MRLTPILMVLLVTACTIQPPVEVTYPDGTVRKEGGYRLVSTADVPREVGAATSVGAEIGIAIGHIFFW